MATIMATAPKLTYPHIEKTTGVRGGKPCIAGTRISSGPPTHSEVHSALAYHYDHAEELEEYLRRSDQAAAEIEAAKTEHLRRNPGR